MITPGSFALTALVGTRGRDSLSVGAATVAGVTLEEGSLAGETVAITGALTGPLRGTPRRAAFRLIAACGGSPARSVTASTTVLVACRVGTAKYAKADALRVPVIGAGEFARLLGHLPLW